MSVAASFDARSRKSYLSLPDTRVAEQQCIEDRGPMPDPGDAPPVWAAERHGKLTAILRASGELHALDDQETILRRLVEAAIELTGATRGGVGVLEAATLGFQAYLEDGRWTPADPRFTTGGGMPEWVMRTGQAWIVNDPDGDPRVDQRRRDALGFRNLLDVPIPGAGDDLLGYLELHDKRDDFNAGDAALVEALAASASIALRNVGQRTAEASAIAALRSSEGRFRALIDHAFDGIYLLDAEGRVMITNRYACASLGYSADQLVGHPFTRITHDPRPASLHAILTQARTQGPMTYEGSHARADGSTIPVEVRIAAIDIAEQGRFIVVARELIARRRAESALRDSESYYRDLIASAPLGIFIHRDGVVMFANPTAARIAGADDAQQLVGRNVVEFVAPECRDDVEARLRDSLYLGVASEPLELELLRLDGTRFDGAVRGVPITYQGHTARQVLVEDITERKRERARLTYLSFYDELTELPNRRLFRDRADQVLAMARRERREIALLYLDIDGFKLVNDSLGHAAGDALLRKAAARLREALRESDTVARLGGDEFAILLAGESAGESAPRVAAKIRELLGQPVTMGERDVRMGVSIGISVFPRDADEFETLLKNADVAMYQAKTRHKLFECFSPAMYAESDRRLRLQTDLREAIEEQTLTAEFSSQHAVSDNRLLGFEARPRWRHPEAGAVTPPELATAVRDAGLAAALNEWVVRTACRQLRAWLDQGLGPAKITVPLAEAQLASPDLARLFANTIAEFAIPRHCLGVEIAASMANTDLEPCIENMQRIAALGARIVMNLFNDGFASIGQIKRQPVHSLKIDRSFIEGLSDDADTAAITMAVTAMAHALELEVLADGVESAAQLELLRAHGCDAAQGPLFDQGMSASAATRSLRASAPGGVSSAGPTDISGP